MYIYIYIYIEREREREREGDTQMDRSREFLSGLMFCLLSFMVDALNRPRLQCPESVGTGSACGCFGSGRTRGVGLSFMPTQRDFVSMRTSGREPKVRVGCLGNEIFADLSYGPVGLSRGVVCEFSRGFCRGFSEDSISLKKSTHEFTCTVGQKIRAQESKHQKTSAQTLPRDTAPTKATKQWKG